MSPWRPPIAAQTITWGPSPEHLDDMLAQIKHAEFEGVEFYQHPELIGPGQRLFELLEKHKLTLVGLAGGSLSDKMQLLGEFLAAAEKLDNQPFNAYAKQYTTRAPYIYVQQWQTEVADEAIARHFRLALHPHMFCRVQTERDAREQLKAHKELRLLPDTAHLTVAGENVCEVIERHYERIEAIHLKDWTAEFGRAYQFYSKGFVELGEGDVALTQILSLLRRRLYDRWLIVEQDHAEDPASCVLKCRRWLRDKFSI